MFEPTNHQFHSSPSSSDFNAVLFGLSSISSVNGSGVCDNDNTGDVCDSLILNESNLGLDSLVDYLSFRLIMMRQEQRIADSKTDSDEQVVGLTSKML